MADIGYLGVALVVLGTGAVAAALAGATRRLFRFEILRRHHEVGSAVFLQLGVVFAVLLAFVFSEVWTEYNSAAEALDHECGALNGVIILSHALPPAARGQMKTLLGDYTAAVIGKEFPSMEKGEAHKDAEASYQDLWLGAVALPAEQAKDMAIRDNILSLLTTAHQNRDDRLFQMNHRLPALIWSLLLALSAVLITQLLFFGMEYITSQMLFTGAFAASLVFILLIVHFLNHPFEGMLRVSPKAFHETAAKVAALPGST